MKHVITIALTIFFLISISFAEDKRGLKDEMDRISYSVGHQVGGDFKRQGVELNPEALLKGIQDALSGTEPMMSRQEMNKTLMDLKKKIMAAQQEEQKKAAGQNLTEGKAFLAENGKKDDVKTLPSGLQYKVITEGSGKTPAAKDTVTVHYRGTLIDGTEFDSSYSRGKPATFGVDRVIKGWTEALQLMKAGAKWQLFIPADLAYGQRSTGSIGPNSTLIFDVELISVKQNDK
jgi:FKBP-type peptidyl-prolyl cis-trans isomerase FklB